MGRLLLPVICLQLVPLLAAHAVIAAAGVLPGAGGGKGGRAWVEPVTGIELVFVEGGCFQMGMSGAEASELEEEVGKVSFDHNFRGELPRHEVCVRDFWIGKHEVTNRQYRLWRPDHDSLERRGRSLDGDSQPAVMVSAEDAEGFLAWLGGKAKRTFRLPTEAEWEYAARSGGREERYAGFSRTADLHRYANFCDASCWGMYRTADQEDGFAVTAPVGSFRPNGLGLHDMIGNAGEWCSDWYDRDYYRKSPRDDPRGPAGPDGPLKERVMRGGSWILNPRNMRAASRHGNGFAVGRHFDGFRVVMEDGPR